MRAIALGGREPRGGCWDWGVSWGFMFMFGWDILECHWEFDA